MALLTRFDRFLFEEFRYDFRSLGIYRLLFASYVLLGCFPAGLWLGDLPAVSFSPPVSLAAFFTHYPSSWLVLAFNALAMTSSAFLLAGLATPVASLVLAGAFLVVRSFCFADGKIDHDILVGVVPLVLAFSGWGNAWSWDSLRSKPAWGAPARPRPWLLAILALLIGMALFTAGLAKLRGGWLSLETRATVWHLLPNYYLVGRDQPMARWALGHFPSALWETMDYATTIWECGVVVLALRRRWFLVACALGCLFHLGVWQLFGITFGTNVIAYAAFVRWGERLPRSVVSRAPSVKAWAAVLGAGLVLSGVALFALRQVPTEAWPLHVEEIILIAGLGCALTGLWEGARDLRSLFPKASSNARA